MKRTLEARVEKLEQADGLGADDAPLIFVDFVGVKDGRPSKSELIGIRVDGELIRRPAGEPEQDFVDRMETEYSNPGGPVLLIAERQG